jgi:NAD(P)-dependent dehydrogenase (short-subunit alcohol dehydrogenase family)
MKYYFLQSALNAISKSMSIDLKGDGIMTICMHPGWVQTDMGGKHAPLKPEQSISRMLSTISKLGPDHNGAFLQYDGKTLSW